MGNTYLQLSLHRVYSPQFIPLSRLYPLSTYFTPLSTYFILLSTNLISLSTYFTPLSTDFILLSTSPPSYLRLDPCLEYLDEIAKVSASWLILNSKRNTQNISSSASLCLSRLLVYMCRVREKYTD